MKWLGTKSFSVGESHSCNEAEEDSYPFYGYIDDMYMGGNWKNHQGECHGWFFQRKDLYIYIFTKKHTEVKNPSNVRIFGWNK